MYKYIALMLCVCGSLVADVAPTSIGIVDEAEQLKTEMATLRDQVASKLAADENLSDEAKNSISKKLDKAQISEELVQKIADESSVSEQYKSKAIKKIRAKLKKADKKLNVPSES